MRQRPVVRPAMRHLRTATRPPGALADFVRARSGGWLRYVHGFVAVVCVAALLATYHGMRTHFLLPAWGHVQTQAELRAFQDCVDAGRTDCVLVVWPEGRQIDSGHPWVKTTG